MIVWSFKILITIVLALTDSFYFEHTVSLSIPIKGHDFCQTPLYNSGVTRFEGWTISHTFAVILAATDPNQDGVRKPWKSLLHFNIWKYEFSFAIASHIYLVTSLYLHIYYKPIDFNNYRIQLLHVGMQYSREKLNFVAFQRMWTTTYECLQSSCGFKTELKLKRNKWDTQTCLLSN